MAESAIRPSRDWVDRPWSSMLAWWAPNAAMLAALLVPMTARAGVWSVALAWMGTACILNVRRCNRTHCRFTGPYCLAMIVPVLACGFNILPAGFYTWIILGMLIMAGNSLIWWATERAWGRFS